MIVEGLNKSIYDFKGSIAEEILANNQPKQEIARDNGTEIIVVNRAIKNGRGPMKKFKSISTMTQRWRLD